ncbi:hypothetical protein SLA2020_185390 [Shorea laevis]
MFSTSEMSNTVSTLLSSGASLAATSVVLRFIPSELIPEKLRSDLFSFLHNLFTSPSSSLTLVINESSGMSSNEVYNAAELYLPTKISPKTPRLRLRLSKTERQKNFAVSIEKDGEIVDIFEGIRLKWRYNCIEPREKDSAEKKFFELSCNKKFKEKVFDSYLPHVLAKAKQIEEASSKVVKLYNRHCPRGNDDTDFWDCMNLEHPATFGTVAIDPEQKKIIIDDLERFVMRRELYKKVGKAWKRVYLLYGPPDTEKSSLIAAMANYLKFDIYSLDLASSYLNSDLRNVLSSTTNRSILVMENIDRSIKVQARENHLTQSGILNLHDELWSSCGDERIIVFTANNKDGLEPVLLHPGRFDVHINLSHFTVDEFRIWASNYLGINNHPLFGEIKSLIQGTGVTPAEVAEELMRNEDADLALQGLVNFLRHKRSECDRNEEKVAEKHKRSECDKIEEEVAETEEANSFKSDNEEKDISAREEETKGGQDSNTKTGGSG